MSSVPVHTKYELLVVSLIFELLGIEEGIYISTVHYMDPIHLSCETIWMCGC